MRIGLFSGSFNPIHKGHTQLADYLLRHSDLDAIRLVVTPNNPLKERSGLLDEKVRLQMAELATDDLPGITASDVEFQLPRPSYTVMTLRHLSATEPEHTFCLIIGQDNMAKFDRWREWEYIYQNYPIYVYPRTERPELQAEAADELRQLQRKYPAMQVIDSAPLFPISATQLRAEICSGTYNSEWLDPKVAFFLQKNAETLANMKNLS